MQNCYGKKQRILFCGYICNLLCDAIEKVQYLILSLTLDVCFLQYLAMRCQRAGTISDSDTDTLMYVSLAYAKMVSKIQYEHVDFYFWEIQQKHRNRYSWTWISFSKPLEPVLGRKLHVESEIDVQIPHVWAPASKMVEELKLWKLNKSWKFHVISFKWSMWATDTIW